MVSTSQELVADYLRYDNHHLGSSIWPTENYLANIASSPSTGLTTTVLLAHGGKSQNKSRYIGPTRSKLWSVWIGIGN